MVRHSAVGVLDSQLLLCGACETAAGAVSIAVRHSAVAVCDNVAACSSQLYLRSVDMHGCVLCYYMTTFSQPRNEDGCDQVRVQYTPIACTSKPTEADRYTLQH